MASSSKPSSSILPPPSSLVPTVTPASLSVLAIYNPSLGSTDEALPDQIVFYTARRNNLPVSINEKLRQIGLAQGIAEFARGFSPPAPTNSRYFCTVVDTQKTRAVTLEVEDGWWLYAQIELTYIHNPTVQPPTAEYSSREVSPTQLLLAQLRRTHALFQFHYGSFSDNWIRMDRASFCRRLERYWKRWAWLRWDVMIHGSPVVDLLAEDKIKMTGGQVGGEIKLPEAEFLRSWAEKEQVHGLVDMIVSRFGEREEEVGDRKDQNVAARNSKGGWFWSLQRNSTSSVDMKKMNSESEESPRVVMPTDGCVFKGIDSFETRSIVDLTNYMTELYVKGDDNYVVDSNGMRRKKRRRKDLSIHLASHPGVPLSSTESSPRRSPSTIRHGRNGSQALSSKPSGSSLKRDSLDSTHPQKPVSPFSPPPLPVEEMQEITTDDQIPGAEQQEETSNRNGKIMNLLTVSWRNHVRRLSRGSNSSAPPSEIGDASAGEEEPAENNTQSTMIAKKDEDNKAAKKKQHGVFIIGFQGDLDIDDMDDDYDNADGRITSRSVWLFRRRPFSPTLSSDSSPPPTPPSMELEEFKIVVYTNKPFMFTLVFDPSARKLTSPTFYRSIHHQLSPLIQTLSTIPSPLPSASTYDQRQYRNSRIDIRNPLATYPPPPYSLLCTSDGTVYSSIPPIPEPGMDVPHVWTRTDALHVYEIMLGVIIECGGIRKRGGCGSEGGGSRERSVKSTRGWWINWLRLEGGVEGFIVRRVGEKGMQVNGENSGQGVLDAKKYFESLVKTVR